MKKSELKLTVFFENPFWVGILERRAGRELTVCRIVFGAQPKDFEVHAFLLSHWQDLRFSPAVAAGEECAAHKNPKRVRREIRRQLDTAGIGTKAQQALKEQQAAGKEARKKKTRQQREAEQQRQFALRQEKKKKKHRGH